MTYRYYILDDGAGEPIEVFRAPLTEEPLHMQQLERAKKVGSWSANDEDVKVVLDRWMIGDFDPLTDEISEIAAFAYLKKWRSSIWPGRP
jgi:hypothetical protein